QLHSRARLFRAGRSPYGFRLPASIAGTPSMEKRRLGQTDMHLSVLGFGGAEIGYERAAPDIVARLLADALDAGLNVIDTAECYFASEELIGQAVASRRNEFSLFTKCGHPDGPGSENWLPRLDCR